MIFGLNFGKKILKFFKIISFSKFRPRTKLLIMTFFLNYLKSMPTNLGCIYRKLKKLLAFQIGRSITFLRKLRLQHTMPFRCEFENGCGHNFGYSWNFYIL